MFGNLGTSESVNIMNIHGARAAFCMADTAHRNLIKMHDMITFVKEELTTVRNLLLIALVEPGTVLLKMA